MFAALARAVGEIGLSRHANLCVDDSLGRVDRHVLVFTCSFMGSGSRRGSCRSFGYGRGCVGLLLGGRGLSDLDG